MEEKLPRTNENIIKLLEKSDVVTYSWADGRSYKGFECLTPYDDINDCVKDINNILEAFKHRHEQINCYYIDRKTREVKLIGTIARPEITIYKGE